MKKILSIIPTIITPIFLVSCQFFEEPIIIDDTNMIVVYDTEKLGYETKIEGTIENNSDRSGSIWFYSGDYYSYIHVEFALFDLNGVDLGLNCSASLFGILSPGEIWSFEAASDELSIYEPVSFELKNITFF